MPNDPDYKQVGGNHYMTGGIDVIDLANAYNLNFLEGNVVKYVVRYNRKCNLQDLEKAKQYLERMIINHKNQNNV